MPGCLCGLLNSGNGPLALLVVDNASADGSAELVEAQFPDVRVIRSPVNLGFAGGANLGIRAAETDLVVLLNPDVTVQATTLQSLASALIADPRAAVAGSKLLYPDGRTIQHAGGTLSYPLALADHHGYGEPDEGQHDETREVDYVTGAAFAVRKSALAEIGYLDEGFYPAYFEETDLCYRARQAGYKVLYVPQAVAIHHESSTTGKNTPRHYHFYHRNRLRFVLKHYSDEQLWRDFLPAEQERLGGVKEAELTALRQAYADNLAALEGRADFVVNPAGAAPLPKSRVRLEVLRMLEGQAEVSLASREAGASLDRSAELRSKCQLTEAPFVSSAPVVGPLVVRFRRLWNWMSTKWYVRPLVQQQNEFNALFVRSLRALESSGVECERAVVRLNTTLARLESRLRRVEERLARLEDGLHRGDADRTGGGNAHRRDTESAEETNGHG